MEDICGERGKGEGGAKGEAGGRGREGADRWLEGCLCGASIAMALDERVSISASLSLYPSSLPLSSPCPCVPPTIVWINDQSGRRSDRFLFCFCFFFCFSLRFAAAADIETDARSTTSRTMAESHDDAQAQAAAAASHSVHAPASNQRCSLCNIGARGSVRACPCGQPSSTAVCDACTVPCAGWVGLTRCATKACSACATPALGWATCDGCEQRPSSRFCPSCAPNAFDWCRKCDDRKCGPCVSHNDGMCRCCARDVGEDSCDDDDGNDEE